MKVWIDQDLCTGDGLCEEIAPAVFTLLDDGLAYVKEGDKVFSDPGGAEGLANFPTACSTRSSSPPRSAPASASSSKLSSRVHASPPRQRPVSTGVARAAARRRQAPAVTSSFGERVARSRCGRGRSANATPITSPRRFDQRAARVAGRERRREHVDVPAARPRAVDVGAHREDLLADPRR